MEMERRRMRRKEYKISIDCLLLGALLLANEDLRLVAHRLRLGAVALELDGEALHFVARALELALQTRERVLLPALVLVQLRACNTA